MHKKLLLPIFILLLVISGCSGEDDDPILMLINGDNSSFPLPAKSITIAGGITNGGYTTSPDLLITGQIDDINVVPMAAAALPGEVTLYINGSPVQKVDFGSDGEFSFNLTNALTSGENSIALDAEYSSGKDAGQNAITINYIDINGTTDKQFDIDMHAPVTGDFPTVTFTFNVQNTDTSANVDSLDKSNFIIYSAGKKVADDKFTITDQGGGSYLASYTDNTCGARDLYIIAHNNDRAGKSNIQTFGTSYSVLAGLNDYEERPLASCINDVNGMKKLLEESEMWTNSQIFTFLDGDATGPRILNKIDAIAINFKKYDAFMFYYSGHGIENYLATSIYGYSDHYISVDELKSSLSKIAAQNDNKHTLGNIFVILDSCYSGTFESAAAYLTEPDLELRAKTLPYHLWPHDLETSGEAFDKSLKDAAITNTIILTAADSQQLSLAGNEYQFSVFTHYLIEGLTGANSAYTFNPPFARANANSDNWISAEEALAYSRPAVLNFCKREGGNHTPQIFDNDPAKQARLFSSWQ